MIRCLEPMMPEATTATSNKPCPPTTTTDGRTNKTGNRASLQSTESSKGKQGTDWPPTSTKKSILTNEKNSRVLTAMHEIRRGLVSPSASTSVWTVPVCIETWVSILASSGTSIPIPDRIMFFQRTYRSTNLDSWQLVQLRNMKVGGNASANDFFTKHGVSLLLSDVDTKKKYSSRVGELYREELARRVKDDVTQSVSTFAVSEISSIQSPPFFY
jgi:hypothetical protein